MVERCLLALARTALAASGSTRLCVSGGVGLNCAANGVLYRSSGATEMFVQPAAGDAGCGLGAALECARRAGRLVIPGPAMTTTALGPSFTDDAVKATLDAYHLRYRYYGDEIADHVAIALADGSIAGWFQGPCEAGPRALGNRSILADPRAAENRDRVNNQVKRREPWRPLAPSILATAADKLVTRPGPADFMIVAYPATDLARAVMPATVHVDGTVRPQAVHEEASPRFARLLAAFEAETGVPAVLNTSFNNEAEPIVCTPADALRTFFTTPLDILAIGGFLLTKQEHA
jgi:carbamoyltransferase